MTDPAEHPRHDLAWVGLVPGGHWRVGREHDALFGGLASVLAYEPSRLTKADDEEWVDSGQRLLMPMPTNEAQESIARRLALDSAAT